MQGRWRHPLYGLQAAAANGSLEDLPPVLLTHALQVSSARHGGGDGSRGRAAADHWLAGLLRLPAQDLGNATP